jgi:hypothetical protein
MPKPRLPQEPRIRMLRGAEVSGEQVRALCRRPSIAEQTL